MASDFAARAYATQSIEARTERADDEARRREEIERYPWIDRLSGPSRIGTAAINAPRRVTESCLAPLKYEDPAFDLSEIPLEEWVAAGEVTQIPWKLQLEDPRLRLDQRYEISYSGRIESKDLRWSIENQHELLYVTGVRSAAGEWVIPPKSARYVFEPLPDAEFRDFRIVSTDCVFLQPGEYFLWSAIYDPENGKRTVVQRRIRTSEFKSDPLPELNSRLPPGEFPKIAADTGLAIEIRPGPMLLTVSNKRPISVEMVSIVSPSDQWPGRSDLIRWQNNRVLAVTSVLSQLQPGRGSVSVAAVDVVNQTIPFEQNEFRELDWGRLAAQFTQVAASQVITLPALESAKKRSSFFREVLEQRLAASSEAMRVLIIVSGSLQFERGSDLSALKVAGDCNCRIYHLRLRLNTGDSFDHIERLIKPLRTKTFDIESALEFREALGEMIQDLDGL